MKRNIAVGLIVILILASLATGTAAVYQKTLTASGLITLENAAEDSSGESSENDFFIHTQYSGSNIHIDKKGIRIKGRGDAVTRTPFSVPEEGYQVSVTIEPNKGDKTLTGIGLYIAGEYDADTKTYYGDMLQFQNNTLHIKQRVIVFGEQGTQESEPSGTYSAVMTADQLTAQFNVLGLIKNGFELSAMVQPDGNGNNQIRIFLNGEEVTALSSPLSRRAYENGIPLYTGVRCWVGQVLFKNLSAGKISSFAADESSVDLLQEPKTVSSQEDLASSSEKEASDSQKIDNENSASDFLSSDESSEKSSVESSKNGEIDKETQQQSQSTTKEEALK